MAEHNEVSVVNTCSFSFTIIEDEDDDGCSIVSECPSVCNRTSTGIRHTITHPLSDVWYTIMYVYKYIRHPCSSNTRPLFEMVRWQMNKLNTIKSLHSVMREWSNLLPTSYLPINKAMQDLNVYIFTITTCT